MAQQEKLPQWVEEFMTKKPEQIKPITENMQRKMDGTTPEVNKDGTRPVQTR